MPKKSLTTQPPKKRCNPQADHPHRTEVKSAWLATATLTKRQVAIIDAEKDVLRQLKSVGEHQPKDSSHKRSRSDCKRKRHALRLFAVRYRAKSLRSQKARDDARR